MTGNDIIDLAAAAAASNWKRKGFLEKLFTAQEQQYIHACTSPATMLWRLWSMKESAYKIYNRQYHIRSFAPTQFACRIIDEEKGTVTIAGLSYQTTSDSKQEYVYSVAGLPGKQAPLFANNCFSIAGQEKQEQRSFIYHKLIRCYAHLAAVQKESISLIKNIHGIPFLHCAANNNLIPVSITHHGSYAAFTIN